MLTSLVRIFVHLSFSISVCLFTNLSLHYEAIISLSQFNSVVRVSGLTSDMFCCCPLTEGSPVRPPQPGAGPSGESRQRPEVPRSAHCVRHFGHPTATLPRDI